MSTTTQDLTRTVDGATVPAVGKWVIDGSHTSAEFVARHLMVTKVRGGFGTITGTVDVAENPTDSVVEVTIDTASITTGDAERDAHLMSADFFDVENHPEMKFVSTAVRAAGSSWILDGDLTIKDITKPVALDFDFAGVATDPWGNKKAAFSATTTINREDWDLNWNVALETGGVLVSKKINLEIEMQAAPSNG
ncbi:MAG: polyisoprenoid-binding protein [Armatimonadetes bacterium]|nr:MAG: polyisoprenoid-binding protein [Armatimonadota bacterium]